MNYVYVAAASFFAGVGIGTFVVRTALTKIATEVRAEAVKEFDALYARYEAAKEYAAQKAEAVKKAL